MGPVPSRVVQKKQRNRPREKPPGKSAGCPPNRPPHLGEKKSLTGGGRSIKRDDGKKKKPHGHLRQGVSGHCIIDQKAIMEGGGKYCRRGTGGLFEGTKREKTKKKM